MRLALACNRSDLYNSKSRETFPEDEFEEFDSPETVEAVAEAVKKLGHTVEILEADRSFPAALQRGGFDFVFNIAEGLSGRCRESQVPAVCEMFGLPYSGSDAITLGITLDKDLAKRVLAGRVPTAAGRLFRTPDEVNFDGLAFPVFAKPNAEGSSKGIRNASRISSPAEAEVKIAALMKEYRGPVLVEEFLPGIECTVGIIGNVEPRVIGVMEISPKKIPLGEFVYSLETKRDYLNRVEYHVPPRVSEGVEREIKRIAIAAYKGLECRDFARIDFRFGADGNPRFIEANPLPGLSPVKSDLVILSKAAGLDYQRLIAEILEVSFKRNRL